MQEIMKSDLRSQVWYFRLVDDCKTILVERGFRASYNVYDLSKFISIF
ncbi:unnamed protein product, partial [marine sediment metagenome]